MSIRKDLAGNRKKTCKVFFFAVFPTFFAPWYLTFGQGRNQTKFGFSPAFSTENLSRFLTSSSYGVTSDFPNVASIEEDESVRYLIKGASFEAGDIVLWDGERKIVANGEKYSADAFPEEVFTPIGVVVIPESHMYDGRARMVSLKWMNCDDPENGSTEPQQMYWGTATDLSGLTNFTQVPAIARYDDDSAGGKVELTSPQAIYTANTNAFLPSDNPSWTGETNPEDEGTRWYQTGTYWTTSGTVNAYNYYLPSPYASDGIPNPLYRATEYSGGSINNALSYFDGRHQTDVILEARGEKDYGIWKPTVSRSEDYPPASCCDMYHTVGTSQGDWYLPSAAELGYVVARLNKINTAMTKVNGMQKLLFYWVWSSSEYAASEARPVNFNYGNVDDWNLKVKDFGAVVAFSAV